MIRFALALSLLVLASCAQQAASAPTPQQIEAAQVYQSTQLMRFEHNMLDEDKEITYANAAVACGLRSQQWLDIVRNVYDKDYAAEEQVIPLSPAQLGDAQIYAESQIKDPTPPAIICSWMANDDALWELDGFVAADSRLLSLNKPS